MISRKKTVIIAVASLFLVQSCAIFRSHIDLGCADQFADQYPAPQESRFVLPWEVGASYLLTQGNCTLETHTLSENQHMSFDFKMPIGTPVLAADDGRVFVVIEQFRDNIDKEYSEANLIGIEHDGGILTWYAHLTFEGALVEVDDRVARGDVIGYSGDTGFSAYPHLHFFAQQLVEKCQNRQTKTADVVQCPQIPIAFSNASPGDRILKEWVRYTALPYQP